MSILAEIGGKSDSPNDIGTISLDAVHRIEDILVQSHAGRAQRSARLQIAIREAIERAMAAAEYRRQGHQTMSKLE